MARQFKVISVSPRFNDCLKDEWNDFNAERKRHREREISFIEFTSLFAGGLYFNGKKEKKEVKPSRPLIRF